MKNESINQNPDTVFNWNLSLSRHSQIRARQRGITNDLLNLAMDYSEAVFKQGLIFFAVIGKLLPDNMDHNISEKLNNMVVVVSPESNEIITCYRSKHAVHQIRRKLKRLSSN
jgi:hypothetical protein